MSETWYAVELITAEESYFAICKSVEELTTYVRVNAEGMAAMKVSAVDPSILAQARIDEVFSDA